MGFDNHATNFLMYASKMQKLGDVATIGRQELHITGPLADYFKLGPSSDGEYCEEFLIRSFGATKVDSFDNSNYENATHIADFNLPIEGYSEYDTVVDAGTLEHIFGVSQAFSNMAKICKEGGQILHISPANNECGHGFWQFSPELFFSLYSAANGFSETKVYLASKDNQKEWFEVKKPENGERVYIQSIAPLLVLCRTKKVAGNQPLDIQQSDYVHVWSPEIKAGNEEHGVSKPVQGEVQGRTVSYLKSTTWRLVHDSVSALSVFRFFNQMFFSKVVLSERNPHLIRRIVADLTKGHVFPAANTRTLSSGL